MVDSGILASQVAKTVSSELKQKASDQVIYLSKLNTIVATVEMKNLQSSTNTLMAETSTTSTTDSGSTGTALLSSLLSAKILILLIN